MHQMFKIITRIVHKAESANYGCTLVIDLNEQPIYISGQHLNDPLDLADDQMLEMAIEDRPDRSDNLQAALPFSWDRA